METTTIVSLIAILLTLLFIISMITTYNLHELSKKSLNADYAGDQFENINKWLSLIAKNDLEIKELLTEITGKQIERFENFANSQELRDKHLVEFIKGELYEVRSEIKNNTNHDCCKTTKADYGMDISPIPKPATPIEDIEKIRATFYTNSHKFNYDIAKPIVVADYTNGLKPTEIAAKYRIGKTTVYKMLNGIPIKKVYRQYQPYAKTSN